MFCKITHQAPESRFIDLLYVNIFSTLDVYYYLEPNKKASEETQCRWEDSGGNISLVFGFSKSKISQLQNFCVCVCSFINYRVTCVYYVHI